MTNPTSGTPGVFVSWIPFHGRSQGFCDALGLTPLFIHYLKLQQPLYAPFKYGPQFLQTLRALQRLKPQVVFAMNPPVFTATAAYIYHRLTGTPYVIDCHSGVFESVKWRWSLPWQRFFARHAAAVLVTNQTHYDLVKSWNATPVLAGNPPPCPSTLPHDNQMPERTDPQPIIFVIARFGPDEAIGEILQAARVLPQVKFMLSGNVNRARPEWVQTKPANVVFTGWLSQDAFWQHVGQADAVLTLTTQENTILQGGWEAMFLAQPLITSQTQTLRNYFTRGTMFVDNTPASIAAGVEAALAQLPHLRGEMKLLRQHKEQLWNAARTELECILGISFPTPSPGSGGK